ncbi:hypothetical protein [Actinospica robiniae]|uniref:hypothetical protein n=1 Tax=Actinospica robiniae TaxID=304901 RepID=UPI0012F724DD|nr:hypothetical protein [Actinospica robiniae]
MDGVEQVVGELAPMVAVAVRQYGADLLTRGENQAADLTVGVARRALRKLLKSTAKPEALAEAVNDLESAPQNSDAMATLRQQLRKILTQDSELLGQIAAMLPHTGAEASAGGQRAVAIGGNNTGAVSTGDHSEIHVHSSTDS